MSADDRSQPSHDRLLADCGLPRLEARILLEHATGRTRSWLIAHGDEPATPQAAARFVGLADRRRRDGEPIAYLTGVREFHGISLRVSPGVLIPRPETELLVDCALDLLVNDKQVAGKPHAVLELGTGSGAITLAIAAARPSLRIVASDCSAAALGQAQSNGARLGLDRSIEWRLGDWWSAVGGDERFGVIVSNPPYIAEGDPHLNQGDLRHEPVSALTSGRDGLDAIRTIVTGARDHLDEGGWLLLEHGFEQGDPVRHLLERAGFGAVETIKDLEGRDRVTRGRSAAGQQTP
jgi:release factor glutamine methyltransferase